MGMSNESGINELNRSKKRDGRKKSFEWKTRNMETIKERKLITVSINFLLMNEV